MATTTVFLFWTQLSIVWNVEIKTAFSATVVQYVIYKHECWAVDNLYGFVEEVTLVVQKDTL